MSVQLKYVAALASLAIALPQGATAKGPDAKLWNGTWHLNAASSKWESPLKQESETRTYDISGGKVTVKASSKDTVGKEMNFSYSAALDGKWYPMTGNPNADQIALTAVSDREIRSKAQLQGKTAAETTAMVSADGKHLTITRKMIRLDGTPTDMLEFNR